ncbi:hypothetical protein BHM03_00022016 [Ensete ventricosum]|nr:hypothetical protein BHM03_00022016 [Ensete ventricosum]
MKKHNSHKHYAKSRVESSFDRFCLHRLEHSKYWLFAMYGPMGSRTNKSRVSIGFSAPPRKFKILAIPNVLAYGKSYEHVFEKKHDGHNLCAKSCA